jgi:hypothetical protein
MISFHHSVESGCIFKNLISEAFQMQIVKLVLGCVFCESLHQTVYLVLGCVSSESLPVFLAPDRMAHRPVYFIAYIYVSTLLQCHFTTQQALMSS